MPRDDVPRYYKKRIAAHVKIYMERNNIANARALGEVLGIHRSTADRVINAQRCGLGNFIKIAKLLGDAHRILFTPAEGEKD